VRDQLIHGFFLGDLRVEPLTGKVSGPGVSGHLPSKSVEILLCLASNPGSVSSHEYLLHEVWGDGRGTQKALSNAVSELRHTLGDFHGDPRFVQTIPTRGYRLLVEPRIVRADLVATNPSDSTAKSDKPRFFEVLVRRGVIQAAAAFLVVGWLLIQVADAVVPTIGMPGWTQPFLTYVVIGGFPIVLVLAWFFEYAEGRFYLDRGKESPTITTGLERNYLTVVAAYAIAALGATIYHLTDGFEAPGIESGVVAEASRADIPVDPNSIAVLPLLNIDGSDESQIFANGLAEDVLDRLAKIPGLRVSSRGDSWSLPMNASSEQVRHRLRVAYYLQGSVRLNGEDLRVVVQLINSATGFQIVSRSFDKKLQDFMEVQKDITNLTVANLRVALPSEAQMFLATSYKRTDVDAYVLYRRGKEQFERPHSDESLAAAVDLYHQALDIDPDYGAAHAGLCVTYAMTYEFSNDVRYIEMAESACASALAASPNLNLVHTALGDLYGRTGLDSEAEAAYLKALDVNNQDVYAMSRLAIVYESQQRLDESENLLNQAIRLQPGNWQSINLLGYFLFSNGRYLEAVDAYRAVVQLDPANWQGHGNLGSALLMAGQFVPAATALERALEIEPSQDYHYTNLAIIHYYLGEFDESVAIHRKAVELSPDANYSWLNLADALLFSSESDQAQEAFRISAELAEKNLAVNPRDAVRLYELAWATAMLGNREYAGELINRSKSIDPNNPYVHYYDGLLRNREGQSNAAIDALQKAIDLGYPAKLLAAEPYLEDLYQEERFSTLVSGTHETL